MGPAQPGGGVGWGWKGAGGSHGWHPRFGLLRSPGLTRLRVSSQILPVCWPWGPSEGAGRCGLALAELQGGPRSTELASDRGPVTSG